MPERCKHDLITDQCADCTGRTGEPPAGDDPEIVARWTARYPGRCGRCGKRILPGDAVGRDQYESLVCEEHL